MAKNSWPGRLFDHARALADPRLKYISWAPALVLLVLLVLLQLRPTLDPQILLRQGDSALKSSQFDLAYRDYFLAAARNPADSTPHVRLGRLFEQTGNYTEAVDELNRAQSLNPKLGLDNELTRLTGLRNHAASLRSELARTALLTEIFPSFRNAWVKLAQLHYELGNIAASKKALTRALGIDPNYEPSLNLQSLLH